MSILNRTQIARDAFFGASLFSDELVLFDIADVYGVTKSHALEMLQTGECKHNGLSLERAIELVNRLSDKQLADYSLAMFELLMTQTIETTTATTRQYKPYHSVLDEEKLAALIADMLENGWRGMPVVADGNCLITGSHRWHAVREIEKMHEAGKTDTEVLLHVVDIRDIYPGFDSHMDVWGNPTIGEPWYTTSIGYLPADVCDRYDIDM
jgi:hypothetical protein